jgi:16S rRNA (guanine(966)-N(2))-methyltransferase RsmD
LRETLFNVLAPKIQESVFADLYAGSGAVGIEAISRGAAFVSFVEQARPALQVLRGNLESLKINRGFAVEAKNVRQFLTTTDRALDIVFLDPPYEEEAEYSSTLDLLGENAGKILSRDAIVIAEHRRREPLAEQQGKLERYRVLEQGDAALSFYRMKA